MPLSNPDDIPADEVRDNATDNCAQKCSSGCAPVQRHSSLAVAQAPGALSFFTQMLRTETLVVASISIPN